MITKMNFNEDNYLSELKQGTVESLAYIIDLYSNLLFKVAYQD